MKSTVEIQFTDLLTDRDWQLLFGSNYFILRMPSFSNPCSPEDGLGWVNYLFSVHDYFIYSKHLLAGVFWTVYFSFSVNMGGKKHCLPSILNQYEKKNAFLTSRIQLRLISSEFTRIAYSNRLLNRSLCCITLYFQFWYNNVVFLRNIPFWEKRVHTQ